MGLVPVSLAWDTLDREMQGLYRRRARTALRAALVAMRDRAAGMGHPYVSHHLDAALAELERDTDR